MFNRPVSNVSETNQFTSVFVPKAISQRFKAGDKPDRFDRLESIDMAVTSEQVIVGDARVQMMDMVESDIARATSERRAICKKKLPAEKPE